MKRNRRIAPLQSATFLESVWKRYNFNAKAYAFSKLGQVFRQLMSLNGAINHALPLSLFKQAFLANLTQSNNSWCGLPPHSSRREELAHRVSRACLQSAMLQSSFSLQLVSHRTISASFMDKFVSRRLTSLVLVFCSRCSCCSRCSRCWRLSTLSRPSRSSSARRSSGSLRAGDETVGVASGGMEWIVDRWYNKTYSFLI